MPEFDALKNDPQAARLMGDPDRLRQLRQAPETQKLFSMLSRTTGGNLEQAAQDASQGNTGQLLSAIRQLMADPEGAKLIQQMKDKLK